MDIAVLEAIKASKDGSFSNAAYTGDLKNEGTGLAPYHQFDSRVPAELKAEVDKVKADIIAGTITIESKSQPS
jgi:basic membrane protein A